MIAQVIEVSGMEKIVEQGLLYDFYGELLTDHQKAIYEDVVINDMSLSEIAREQGISRQGVHDMIKRCDRILNGYEEKLGLVEKFLKTKKMVEEIHRLTEEFDRTQDRELIARIGEISNDIIELE
ncbi:MAG: DNA-binding protein [Clostridium sp.]|nr:DNA-binding protein [Clostridium sp.]